MDAALSSYLYYPKCITGDSIIEGDYGIKAISITGPSQIAAECHALIFAGAAKGKEEAAVVLEAILGWTEDDADMDILGRPKVDEALTKLLTVMEVKEYESKRDPELTKKTFVEKTIISYQFVYYGGLGYS
jgi:hypothetical protein